MVILKQIFWKISKAWEQFLEKIICEWEELWTIYMEIKNHIYARNQWTFYKKIFQPRGYKFEHFVKLFSTRKWGCTNRFENWWNIFWPTTPEGILKLVQIQHLMSIQRHKPSLMLHVSLLHLKNQIFMPFSRDSKNRESFTIVIMR